jgi:hypothetical protein
VTIESVNQNGQIITGYLTILRTSSGFPISIGYTTNTFTLVAAGLTYQVEVDGHFGACTFSHWQDTGSKTDLRTFTQASGPMTLVGVFNCTGISASTGQPVSLGLAISALLSEFAMPIGLLSVAAGGLFTAHTKSRFAERASRRA